MFVTAIAGLVATGSMLAPPAVINVPLKLTKVDRKQNQYVGLSFYGVSKGTQNLRDINVPKSMGVTHSCLMYFSEDPMALAAAKDPKANRFAVIWFDFNRNKKFEESEKATYSGKDKVYSGYDLFEFKGKPVGLKGKIYASAIASGTQMAGLVPLAAMEGTFKVAGQNTTAKVLDSDYDGRFGTKSRYGGDTLLCTADRPMNFANFDQLISMSDGRFYTAAMSKDGKSLVFTRDETPMGTLAVAGSKLQSLQLSSPKGNLSPVIVNGEANVPATEYMLSYASVEAKNADGKTYQVSYASSGQSKVKVSANQTTELKFGDGMKLSLSCANAGPSKSFNINLNDKNGFKVSGLYDRSNNNYQQPKEPEVVIYGPDGSVVDKQTFHYG